MDLVRGPNRKLLTRPQFTTNLLHFLFSLRYPPVDSSNTVCSCRTSFDCVYPAGIYTQLSGMDIFNSEGSISSSAVSDVYLPGMLVGCFTFNTILQSTLECFYDSDCLQLLQSIALYYNSKVTQLVYNSSVSRFPTNTTIQEIVNELFLEQWIGESNYSAFYSQCQPNLCTYSYVSKGGIATAIATIIGLFGSLSVAMKVAAPIIINICYFMTKKWMAATSIRTIHVKPHSNNTSKL